MDKFILNKNNSLLLIIDIQDKLASVMDKRKKVVDNVNHLIEVSKLLNIPIIITEQYPRGIGPTVREIRENTPHIEAIEKVAFDCCKHDGFLNKISAFSRKQIIIAGMESHICVLQTSLSLLKHEYMVHIASDALCSRKKHDYRTGIEMMRDAGAVITGTETILFQLLEKSGTTEFKTISQRIK